jgi:uncharacterized membrane protein YkvA (DUF1232 family)
VSSPPDSKWQQVYERLAARARELLDDPAALQRLIDAADHRAESFRQLRDDLAPIRRLVLSYLKGSYRDASVKELAQAVAAISYVASPIDLIPDFGLWGLKDDAKFVRWMSDVLAEPLAAYAAWEHSLDPIEPGQAEVLESPLPASRSEMEVAIIDRDEALLGGSDLGGGPPLVAVQQLVQSSKAVRDALHSGQVVRVVGPRHLLRGLEKGTLELVPTASGKLGTVRRVDGKRFAGQLRLGQGGAANVAKVTVSAGFAIASAVTMQYYLASMDSQLRSIRQGLEGLQEDVLDEQLGKIDAARDACVELQEVSEQTGRLGTQDLSRLVHADSSVDDVFKALYQSLGRFGERAESTMGDLSRIEKDAFAEFLRQATAKRVPQTRMLIYAAAVRDRINALRVLVAAEDGEGRVRIAEETRERELREMYKAVHEAFAALDLLHIPKRRLDETWPHLGGPEKELAAFVAAFRQLRSLHPSLETIDGDEAVIRAPTPRALPQPEPILTELFMQDGDLRVAQVALRPGSG